jgi:hypothetical protein
VNDWELEDKSKCYAQWSLQFWKSECEHATLYLKGSMLKLVGEARPKSPSNRMQKNVVNKTDTSTSTV